MGTESISDFFDREACCRAGGASGMLSRVSRRFLASLEGIGLAGNTVLDVGCGTGGLAVEVLRRGASEATGIDLSPGSIDLARHGAAEAGLSDRSSFEVGDGAEVDLRPHDVVLLDKVICCYPEPDRLVARSVAAARSLYGFVLPASRGLRGVLARVGIFLENAWRWIRRDPFRSFVHDVRTIDAAVRRSGFRPVLLRNWWMWHLAVYERVA